MIFKVLLVVSIILNGIFLWGLIRAANIHAEYEATFEEYDEFFQEQQNRLIKTINTMKEIDIRGSFQADDEIGSIFQQIQAMIGALDVFILARSSDSDASEE